MLFKVCSELRTNLKLIYRKRTCMVKGPVNLGGVLSCRTKGVRSTPGVRGGASPAYYAVPKSRELGSPPFKWGS